MKPYKPPKAIVTNVLIGLCVAVQAAVALGGGGFGAALDANFGLVPARIAAAVYGGPDLLPAAVTLITHMFLHGGWLHLGLNMLFLAWVGKYVEWVAGGRVLSFLFVAGGIAGGLLQVVVDPKSLASVIGASGAIAAVFAGYAVLFSRNRVISRSVLGVAVPGEALKALWYAATWIGLQLLTALAFNTGPGGGQIAIWTHIGGFIAGLLLVQPWARGPRRLLVNPGDSGLIDDD